MAETNDLKPKLIVVTGPTATGKTMLAARLAAHYSGEIISADSRQVYRGMDLATGKDLEDYIVDGKVIPHHLVDILDAGYEYNVFEFQRDFIKVFNDITSRGKTPVLCGGTGMYVEAVLKGYKLIRVPENKSLREELSMVDHAGLISRLEAFKIPHNKTDTEDLDRLIRAIEIQIFYKDHPELDTFFPKFDPIVIGVKFERSRLRERITHRLKTRLEAGMADEAKELLDKGLSPEQLKFYGLEYRYLTQLVTGELSYDDMFQQLNTAIHQFAKRQATWFRRMERKGIKIHWIDGEMGLDRKVEVACRFIDEYLVY